MRISQVTKTFVILKHAIHRETILDFLALPFRRDFFSADDLKLCQEAFRLNLALTVPNQPLKYSQLEWKEADHLR
jgi:hypothetical protein